MAAPAIVQTYPAHGDVGIPVGATMLVYFDNLVDHKTLVDSLILHGPDFDFQTGPRGSDFITEDGARNPYFLSSPGFTGVAPLKVELALYTLGTTDIVPNLEIVDEAAGVTENVGHVAIVTLDPSFNALFKADTSYTLTVVGDPDSQGVGISQRTIYDVTGTPVGDGAIFVSGTYGGLAADTVHVKITRAGDVNVAKYKWWYESAGEVSAVTGRIVSARFRLLDDGVSVRFGGDNFVVDDEWQFNVEPIERLATNTRIVFTTNDGTYVEAPASPSTPPTSLPPSTVLPWVGAVADGLRIVSITPADGSYNNDGVNEIVIVFNKSIDEDTVNADTLKLFTYPVEGLYDAAPQVQRPLAYTFTVAANVLTIRI